MTEYMHARVRFNNVTMFTVVKFDWEGWDHVFPWHGGVYSADKYSLF